MAIPDFQSLMLPLLNAVSDGGVHVMKNVVQHLSDHFSLTEEERQRLQPSGLVRVMVNRVHWAKLHLLRAGVIEQVKRGTIRITPQGKKVLADPPAKVDLKYLMRFPAFAEWGKAKPAHDDDNDEADVSAKTPEERIGEAYSQLREALAEELLQQVKDCTDKFFERLVVDLLVAMGYGGSIEDAGKAVGRSGDGGIDGVIKEDRLGLDVVVVQAKKWTTNPVGRPDVQSFAGSMEAHRANKGVFITTSTFSEPAKQYVGQIQRRIVLIDGPTLASFMIDHGIGVTSYQTFNLKRLDSDYFEE